ncbi:MAG: GTPase domain-containing protein [Sandaracinaceae bacterium]|nr:GTPase domain-containing protein [Sandaracinaceae bacterium]
MTVINPLAREISAKVVYYGPGLSGKTTTLKQIYAAVKPQRRGEMVTLATEGDRTIFFDFLPLHVKEVQGMGVRFQLYTVPGQVFYEATRKLVLQGADGVIFVADSQPGAAQGNRESLADLRRNLDEQGIDVARFPIVFQWNKRDLGNVREVREMEEDLNWLDAPSFPTSATRGDGVLPALKEVSKLVIHSLWDRFPKVSTRRHSKPLSEGIEAEVAKVAREVTASGEFMVTGLDDEAEVAEPIVVNVPENALSFASLWEGEDAATVAGVEGCIRRGDHGAALQLAVSAMVELLETLPGTGNHASPMAKAALLGLDGREFLRFCRLAGLHATAATERDALFALYLLVSARLKASLV